MNKQQVPVVSISRTALRLLTALAEPGSLAVPDSMREGSLIVRSGLARISLGRGWYPQAAADELLRRDLVGTRSTEAGRGPAYSASEAGLAYLRRRQAGQDDANPFGAQHRHLTQAIILEEAGPARVAVNTAENPLDWLRRRKGPDGEPMIDAASFEAGERLRRDLTFGGMLPSVTARWEGGGIGGTGGLRDPAGATDAVIAARQRVRAALEEVGADFADILLDLCGFLKGLETLERERRWPARSAKVVVRLALRRLADHYGLETEARGPARSLGLRGWTAGAEPT